MKDQHLIVDAAKWMRWAEGGFPVEDGSIPVGPRAYQPDFGFEDKTKTCQSSTIKNRAKYTWDGPGLTGFCPCKFI